MPFNQALYLQCYGGSFLDVFFSTWIMIFSDIAYCYNFKPQSIHRSQIQETTEGRTPTMLISLLMAFSWGAATVAISIPAASHAAAMAMPSSAGPQFQYERPPPPRPWLKWLLMVFTKDPNSQSWLAKNRSTDRPTDRSWMEDVEGERREEKKAER